uniref:Ribosome production factor 1 n=1 Tax=Zonotrichia albicollis TaxID=44394 RepID=A0A8D2MKV1_ZONAL
MVWGHGVTPGSRAGRRAGLMTPLSPLQLGTLCEGVRGMPALRPALREPALSPPREPCSACAAPPGGAEAKGEGPAPPRSGSSAMAGEGSGPAPGDAAGPPAPERVLFPPTFSVSEIKNKQRRHFMFLRWKQQQRKEKLALKKKRRKEREALGDKAPPKAVPKTIENQRVYDETTVDPNDEEVAFDEATDEFAPYFNRQTVPKILITTSDRPRGRTVRFCEQLATVIPNSHVFYRRGLALKRIIPQCIARDFTDLIVINEDRKIPNGLVLSHLPDGPTAHFRMSSVRLRKEIKRKGKEPTEHVPEVILNNFTTRLGHSIGRMFAALFPHDPQFIGRQVATFHNQRDYIFFRFHRYIFKSEKKVGIQELGPRFTLKLRSLQKGTFDSKFGEYEWIHKRREMDTSRRKFHL